MVKKRRNLTGKILTYVALTFFSALFIVPLLWMIFTSFKDYSQNMAYPPTWLPDPWYWGNYKEALFEVVPYFKYFFNSAFIVVIGVAATVVTCTMVAYGFARFRCRENKYLFIIVLSTMMLPTQVTMISSYWIWAQVKMVDTYVPLLIGAFFGGSAFYIFLVRQFVMSVPRDFEEAARVDGAGTARIFLTITLPMLKRRRGGGDFYFSGILERLYGAAHLYQGSRTVHGGAGAYALPDAAGNPVGRHDGGVAGNDSADRRLFRGVSEIFYSGNNARRYQGLSE